MKTMELVINSRGRPNEVLTLEQIPVEWLGRTVLVVSPSEYKQYKQQYGSKVPIETHPEELTNLTTQRQWVMESSFANFVMMLDDDLTFSARSLDYKLHRSTDYDMCQMLEAVHQSLTDGYALVGVSSRYMNNQVEQDFITTTRISRAYALDRDVFMKLGLNFLPKGVTIPFSMQDFHITLELLKRGYDNKVFYKWCQNDKGSNTSGGCSSYRTLETLRKSAVILSQLHHPFVKLKVKTTKGSWANMEGAKATKEGTSRVDVVVSWKKALKKTARQPGGFDNL